MGTDDYSKALAAAEKELVSITSQIELFEQRRAQLEQTVSALKTLMNVAQDEERTLTETIKTVVRGANDYISATDVLKGVMSMGKFSGKSAVTSVPTILGRLQKEGLLERHPWQSGMYRWKRKSIDELRKEADALITKISEGQGQWMDYSKSPKPPKK